VSVALLMGSDSDFARLEPCVKTLGELEIACEVRVLSAHRTPKQTVAYVEGAAKRGIRVFICAAGGAAHLAGVVSAHTDLPVLGIPLDNPPLNGLDSLLSTVQMPGGVPVATMAIGAAGAKNAGLFAVAVLATTRPALRAQLQAFRDEQAAQVRATELP
jgi:phosphoribosylaminoimidazole carboxylase PurE protein